MLNLFRKNVIHLTDCYNKKSKSLEAWLIGLSTGCREPGSEELYWLCYFTIHDPTILNWTVYNSCINCPFCLRATNRMMRDKSYISSKSFH